MSHGVVSFAIGTESDGDVPTSIAGYILEWYNNWRALLLCLGACTSLGKFPVVSQKIMCRS